MPCMIVHANTHHARRCSLGNNIEHTFWMIPRAVRVHLRIHLLLFGDQLPQPPPWQHLARTSSHLSRSYIFGLFFPLSFCQSRRPIGRVCFHSNYIKLHRLEFNLVSPTRKLVHIIIDRVTRSSVPRGRFTIKCFLSKGFLT